MKTFEKILVLIVSAFLVLYAAIVLLFSLPVMQNTLAGWTANVLSKQIKSKVDIGSINIGLLNRVIVNDVVIYEPSGKQFASIARVSANVNPSLLLADKISIGTAQLFGVKAQLYRDFPDSAPNYQFLVDAFQNEENDDSTRFDFSIGSLLMRHVDISYDILSEKPKDSGIDLCHLRVKDGGMNLVLKCLTNDSLNVSVRNFHAKEQNSGFVISNAQLYLTGNTKSAVLSGFSLSLPHSEISVDTLNVNYEDAKKRLFHFTSTPISGHITPRDLQAFQPTLAALTTPLQFNVVASGNEKDINIGLRTNDKDNTLRLNVLACMSNVLDADKRHLSANIETLHIRDAYIQDLVSAFMPQQSESPIVSMFKDIAYHGNVEWSFDGTLSSVGKINTSIGDADYDIVLHPDKAIAGTIEGDSINIGALLNDETVGTASFSLDVATNLSDKAKIPDGNIVGKIYNVNYNGYNYHNIDIDVAKTASQIAGEISVDDDNLKMKSVFAYSDASTKAINMQVSFDHLNPHRLNFTQKHVGEKLSLNADIDLLGIDFKHLFGHVNLNDIRLVTPTESFQMHSVSIKAEQIGDKENRYTVNSDVVKGSVEGNVSIVDIVTNVTNQLANHFPVAVKPKPVEASDFTYKFTIADAPIIHHFIDADIALTSPITINGNLNSVENQMTLLLSAPKLSYDGKTYDAVSVECYATDDNMNVNASAHSMHIGDAYNGIPPSNTNLNVTADIHDNTIDGSMYLDIQGANNISLALRPTVQMKDSLGSVKTFIALHRSEAVINDTTWTVTPSSISFYRDNIRCNGVKFANNNTNSSLAIDGRVSSSPSDSIVARLNNLEIKYLLSLVDFDAVRFAGRASGTVTAKRLRGSNVTPDLKAHLQVSDMSVQEGVIGDADILAKWDKAIDGISVDGRIIDLYQVPDALTGNERNVTGITTVKGWVSPAKNDIRLDINTLNTNAAFLHGFLGGVFSEVSGYVSGPISIVGPLNNINIVGEAIPNMNLRLRATNVPYHVEGDTIHLRPYLFDFPSISLYDRFGNRSTVTGQVTHRNMKNFAYTFDAELHETLVYDETEFNSDKFFATVFADGTLSVDGRDGHPLHVNANVTPTQGSVFAYDAATPDAITGDAFIEYRDRDQMLATARVPLSPHTSEAPHDSLAVINEAKNNYDSDIFVNFDINLTPACEVKLRMNNTEDGYIQTFGNAKFTAQWYNKGSFQLFGKYDIETGAYRLYLQDIIFRDLALQPGSSVEFNGDPFNANIHLICHHTINSVPLSDLTSTTAFSQNNKVKVICILDITGKLGNMDFKFGMDMPNVSEESKQLVNSIINSDEEMNTQMIYLLGFGRFYPSEYARANGGNSTQAVNSLLSSTLSGQLNQMLSSVIGNNSNWNFGSTLTTGEQGWNDLDVEGSLSGRLLDERLLIDGNFGYRDNALTQRANFIGDFEIKWRITPKGNLYAKAYNLTNDRYFTKATLNTQGIGLSWQRDFELIRQRMKEKEKKQKKDKNSK
ncbi:MAG: translocation/assembly module TamB domain-containing protein [Prevotellaceae bacterium]|nr:translocation/assembly module TamB domain-containing protein [Prevotellaceae bacterium]